jgi:hypothetical protein
LEETAVFFLFFPVWLRSVATILPIARLSVQMHYRNNLNPAILDAVNDAERKSGNAALAPHLAD